MRANKLNKLAGLSVMVVVTFAGEQILAQEDPLELLIQELTHPSHEPPLSSVQAEEQLMAAIELYQAIRRVDGWVRIPGGPVLTSGEMSGRTELIRQRLIVTGDLKQPDRSPGNYFDASLAEGVRRFQVRHGLQVDARIGRDTLAAMNVPVSARLAQLRRNLTRLRNLRSAMAEARYVLVNIPAFDLTVVEHNTVRLTSRVIVGRKDRQTPELSSRIRSIDFRPTWNVPPGIARNDLIPKLRSDPGYFARENISVYLSKDGSRIDPSTIDWQSASQPAVRFRQHAGPWNVLGRIRLNMPNDAFIYLHDTPVKSLFGRSSRAFSSGCVRVAEIVPLTSWLLSQESSEQAARAETFLQSDRSLTVDLQQTIPVHLVYLTAWAQTGAIAHFRQDIYGLDLIGAGTMHDEGRLSPVPPISPITP